MSSRVSSIEDRPIVVIGAGSTGSSTAYHLSKSGQPVVLVDKSQVASGMTSFSTAVVRTFYSNDFVVRMALYSREVLRNFHSLGNSGFTQTGMLTLVTPEMKDGVCANVAMLNSIGARNEVMDVGETAKRFPQVNVADCDFVVFEPESGYADPVGTATAYALRAEELGCQIISRQKVEKLETENGIIKSVTLSEGHVNCSKAILCTNIWTNKLLLNSGVDKSNLLPISVAPHPVGVFKRPKEFQGNRPIVGDWPNKTYYKPEGHSLLFAGSLDTEIDKQNIDPDMCPSDVPFEFVNFFSETISRRIPSMVRGTFHSSYFGMYDITPDQHPIVDELAKLGLGGVYCCVGLSGHGFKLCPALGVMNAEMILGKDNSELTFDRSHFALSRFKTGRMIGTRFPGLGGIA